MAANSPISATDFKALPIHIRSGATIYVPPTLQVITSYVLLEQESWFEDEVDFVRSILLPGECAIDIGANFGVYTVGLAEAVGSSGKIFGFEPAAQTSAYLRGTVQLRHRTQVELIQAAVSNHSGRALLKTGVTPELNAIKNTGDEQNSGEMVDVLAIDEFFSKDHPKIAFIKIDAEGHELAVGRGAKVTILKDQPLIMFEIRDANGFDFRFLEFLELLGFSGYRLAPRMNLLVPFDRTQPIDKKQLNLFACSSEKADQLSRRGALARHTGGHDDVADDISSVGTFDNSICCLPRHSPRSTTYRDCLNHYSLAHATSLEPNARLAHIREALRLGKTAAAERNSLARRVTLARIAADFGQRSDAVTLLRSMTAELMKPEEPQFDEVCLSPSSRHLPVHEQATDNARLRIASLETLERLRAYSSLYTGEKSLPFLDYLCDQPFAAPEMFRRRQLVRMRCGLQRAPEPHPALVIQSPDNLNAWFWRGTLSE